MNEDFFENLVNQIIWNYIRQNQTIIYSCPDHNYTWSPQGYLLQVYVRKEASLATLQIIKQQLSCCIQQLTGLKTSRIKISYYTDDCLSELK